MSFCRHSLLHRLSEAPGWVGRAHLVENIGFGETVVDQVLSDLVIAGMVLFNSRVREYRLAGEPLAREALRELLAKPTLKRMVIGRPQAKRFRIGIAQRDVAGQPGFMAEFELDYPGSLEGVLRLQQVIRSGWGAEA